MARIIFHRKGWGNSLLFKKKHPPLYSHSFHSLWLFLPFPWEYPNCFYLNKQVKHPLGPWPFEKGSFSIFQSTLTQVLFRLWRIFSFLPPLHPLSWRGTGTGPWYDRIFLVFYTSQRFNSNPHFHPPVKWRRNYPGFWFSCEGALNRIKILSGWEQVAGY